MAQQWFIFFSHGEIWPKPFSSHSLANHFWLNIVNKGWPKMVQTGCLYWRFRVLDHIDHHGTGNQRSVVGSATAWYQGGSLTKSGVWKNCNMLRCPLNGCNEATTVTMILLNNSSPVLAMSIGLQVLQYGSLARWTMDLIKSCAVVMNGIF